MGGGEADESFCFFSLSGWLAKSFFYVIHFLSCLSVYDHDDGRQAEVRAKPNHMGANACPCVFPFASLDAQGSPHPAAERQTDMTDVKEGSFPTIYLYIDAAKSYPFPLSFSFTLAILANIDVSPDSLPTFSPIKRSASLNKLCNGILRCVELAVAITTTKGAPPPDIPAGTHELASPAVASSDAK